MDKNKCGILMVVSSVYKIEFCIESIEIICLRQVFVLLWVLALS
jgi:hypothetical protein